jgi:hypothetical protein
LFEVIYSMFRSQLPTLWYLSTNSLADLYGNINTNTRECIRVTDFWVTLYGRMIREGTLRTTFRHPCISVHGWRKLGKPARTAGYWKNFRPAASQIRVRVVTSLLIRRVTPLHASDIENVSCHASHLNRLAFYVRLLHLPVSSLWKLTSPRCSCVWHATACQPLICMRSVDTFHDIIT